MAHSTSALGGGQGFADLAATMRQHGIKLILDIVPNHMGASPGNAWWRDVLEWGRSSADHFDIDWSAPKLLVPALARLLRPGLDAGAFSLAFEAETGGCCRNMAGCSCRSPRPSYAHIIGRLDPTTFGAWPAGSPSRRRRTRLNSKRSCRAGRGAVRSAIIEGDRGDRPGSRGDPPAA